MKERQRELAQGGDAVIEGRDIGTVVCPDAEVKVYLVADPGERARRRQADHPDIGAEALATDLRLRDERDAAQMQAARDAEKIDTTALTVDEVLDRIERLVEERASASAEASRPRLLDGRQGLPRQPDARSDLDPGLREGACAARGRRCPRHQPLQLHRRSRRRHHVPTPDGLRREERAVRRPGALAAHRARTGRSRSGAASRIATRSGACARPCGRTTCWGSSSRARARRAACPGRPSRVRPWSRSRRGCRWSRRRSTARRPGSSATARPSPSRSASRCASPSTRATPRATRRPRRRSWPRSSASGSGSSGSTSSAGHATPPRREASLQSRASPGNHACPCPAITRRLSPPSPHQGVQPCFGRVRTLA